MTEFELRQLLSKRIRCRLNILHIDQRELARRTGLSEATISKYIKCHRKPTYDNVIRIAQALDCSPSDLIDIDELLE